MSISCLKIRRVAGLMVLLLSAISVGATDYVDYYKEYTDDPNVHIYTSYTDWTPMAQKITSGCADDYQRIRAIYQWVCENIDYDTTYSIYRADSCLQERKGVCQGYCELFYQLAKAVGVRVELVGGYSKNHVGFISSAGHMWLFAYTSKDRGIFLDPTWGAGIVNDHKFVRNDNIWTWFNVEPEWLILSHFPDNSVYQMVTPLMTMDEFRALTPANPLWRTYGLDVCELYAKARDNTLELPQFYNRGEGDFEAVDIPLRKSLKVGETYTFRIRMKADREFALMNKGERCMGREWKQEGDGVYSTEFMVRDTGQLTLSLKSKTVANYWDNVLLYGIEPPTEADWAKVERLYPLCVPDAKHVKNLDAQGWQLAGVDGRRLLGVVRKQHVKALPTIYYNEGQRLQIIEVPMNESLKIGETYTFAFRPQSGTAWAVINEGSWYKDFTEEDGVYKIEVTPQRTGTLALYVQLKGRSYLSCLEYKVSQ